MSYTIPPDSPKAVKAAAFGRELVKAIQTRQTTIKEVCRATGVGHSSIDNYRRGRLLPKTEVARALALALEWPKLAEMIIAARTFTCGRKGCGRTFRNETGAPKKYCSPACQRIVENLRIATRRARQKSSPQAQSAYVRRLKGGLDIASEQTRLLQGAIDAMCAGCEPEGLCRTDDCALRPFSPLPLIGHSIPQAPIMTEFMVRQRQWTPERRAAHSERMKVRWQDPAYAERVGASLQAAADRQTPAERAERGRKVSETKRADPAARGGDPRAAAQARWSR